MKNHTKNILVYNISYKTSTDPKTLQSRFNNINEFIRFYDGTRYLVLFWSENVASVTTELDIL